MRGAVVVAGRELRSYFNSPIAYIFMVTFLVACGVFFFFMQGFFAAGQATLRGWFGLMPIMLSVLVPALTMRLWAEEKRQGTYELLLTMPFSEAELVVGKYLAALAVVAAALAASLPLPLMVSLFGIFDAGQIAAQYAGILLLASASVALGQALSSLTKNQMSAFLASVVILVGLNLLAQVGVWLALPPFLAAVVNWVSLQFHFQSFAKGVLDTRDLAYFVVLTAGFLYLTAKNLAFGKWR